MIRSFTRWAALASTTAALAFSFAAAPAQGATFNFSNTNCNSFTLTDNGGGNFTLNCQTSTPGTFGCSVGQSISAPTVAQGVTLTANCSNAAGSIAYTWSAASANAVGCPSIPSGASQASLTAPGGLTALSCGYNLSANDGATTATGNRTVNYATGGGGGGGGGGGFSGSCPGIKHTAYLIESWANPVKVYTANAGGFNINDVAVIQFTTGSLTVDGRTGGISGVEFGSATSPRFMTLSTQPCDFTSGNVLASNTSTAPQISFSVGTNSIGAPQLSINTTYYVNVMNVAPASCAVTGICDMDFQMAKPRGL
jgi:hypothetical protein